MSETKSNNNTGSATTTASTMRSLGRHLLCEYHGCDRERLNRHELIREELLAAVKLAGATPIQEMVHNFTPHGVTGVVVIAESHFAIHTWPEYGFAAVDLFTCGDSVDPWVAFEHLAKVLRAANHSVIEMRRGLLPAIDGQKLPHKPGA